MAFSTDHGTLDWILRIVGVYTLITFGMAICAVLEFAWVRFDERENTENHPLKGVLNVCRGLVWIIIGIVSVSVLIDKSPMALLAGLGAFAAALMLIFASVMQPTMHSTPYTSAAVAIFRPL